MSLNSHVTSDGGEMGRAQVVQAVAAGVEPDHRMNPVLLKPNSDAGSQVIINGKPVGNMDVRQYHAYKKEAWKAVVLKMATRSKCPTRAFEHKYLTHKKGPQPGPSFFV